jgi:uncharacterized protein with PIN domain
MSVDLRIIIQKEISLVTRRGMFYCDVCKETKQVAEVVGSNDKGDYRVHICKDCSGKISRLLTLLK